MLHRNAPPIPFIRIAKMNQHAAAPMRDLASEVLGLIDLKQMFTDIHIEQDRSVTIKTPRGWVETSEEPVLLDDMRPLLDAIDEHWESALRQGTLDRPFVLTRCRLRCHVYRAGGGRKIVISMRRLPLKPLPLEELGLPVYVRSMLDNTKGIILVTGPTGSGKTTTIASLLEHVNATRNTHIVTIEEPIEYYLERRQSIISQREVPTDTPNFPHGLREALRQKPDVVMVGEVRDAQTADTLLQAGESGHLVLATMHTGSAVSALNKLLSFFPAGERDRHAVALAESLIGIVCQSLVPSADGESLVLASELLFNNNNQVAKLIADPTKLHLVNEFLRRREDNMSRSLNDDLAALAARNRITTKDALRATYNRLELHEMMQSIVNR
ncbi:putative twitching motility protein PilT [Burkholderia humptydooensis MSMB43]|nr:putative twitching motility protein PilT [Burkholderia humptydooensis MSMB43]